MVTPLQLPGFDNILFIIPLLLCCVLMPMLQKRGKGQSVGAGLTNEADMWYFKDGIESTYETVSKSTEGWKNEGPENQPKRLGVFGGAPSVNYRISESVSPRLMRMASPKEGEVCFELTEVEGGGTLVKTNYTPSSKHRIQTLKASLPVKSLVMKPCDNCSKLILSDYTVCPYCESKQD